MSDFNLYISGTSLFCASMMFVHSMTSSESDAKKLRSHWKWAAFNAFVLSLCWYVAELDVRDHKLMEELCATPTPK